MEEKRSLVHKPPEKRKAADKKNSALTARVIHPLSKWKAGLEAMAKKPIYMSKIHLFFVMGSNMQVKA